MRRALVLTALAVGCTEPATQVLVVVHSYGLKVGPGGDVDALRLLVKSDAKADDQTAVFDKDNPLCGDLSQPACWTLPVTATLVPGPDHPNDLVVVKVLGLRGDKQVIGDQASFHFLHDVSQRLDFVLYANCLDVDCTMQDAACNYAGECQPVQPMTFTGEPQLDGLPPYLVPDLGPTDLAGADLTHSPADLSLADLAPLSDLSALSDPTPRDLAAPQDLAAPRDLTPPQDLSSLQDLSVGDLSTPQDLAGTDLIDAGDLASSDMSVPLWLPIAPSLPPAVNLRAVWGFGSNEVYVVGTGGTILHSANAGGSWSFDNAFTSENLNSVWGDASGVAIFAAGDNGTILQRQPNGTWPQQSNPWESPIADLRGIWGDSPGEFAVAGSGFSFGTWDGAAWTELCGTHDDVDSFHALAGTSLLSLLVAGVNNNQGEVRAFQQAVCTALGGQDMSCDPCPLHSIFNQGPPLNAVSSFGAGGFAVGVLGTIVSCTPTFCMPMTNPPKQDLFGVWSEPTASRNFAVGDDGLIENLTTIVSSSWVQEASGVSSRLNGVWGVPGGVVYAVGDNGVLLKRQ